MDAPHTPHPALGKKAKFFFLASVCENTIPGIRYRVFFSERLYWRLVMLLYKGQNGRKRYLAKLLNKMAYINSGNPSDVKSHKKKGTQLVKGDCLNCTNVGAGKLCVCRADGCAPHRYHYKSWCDAYGPTPPPPPWVDWVRMVPQVQHRA